MKFAPRVGRIEAAVVPASLSRGDKITVSGLSRESVVFVVDEVRPSGDTWIVTLTEESA